MKQAGSRTRQAGAHPGPRSLSIRSYFILAILAAASWSLLFAVPHSQAQEKHTYRSAAVAPDGTDAAGDGAPVPAAETGSAEAGRKAKEPYRLPVELNLSEKGSHFTHTVAVSLATFISEDLTCITVGLLIRGGELNLLVGVIGCFVGIFMGDFGLWLLGRFGGRRLIRWKRMQRFFPADRLDRWGEWFDRHGWTAIVASRCVPGTRVPTYIGAGMVGHNAARFALWALLAGLIWTPVLIALAAFFGPIVARPFEAIFGAGWISLIAALLTLLVLVRVILLMTTKVGRSRLTAALTKCYRYEFWPPWVFYLPLVPWVVYLAIRHRGFTTATAVNPAIPDGGLVGESKFDILRQMHGQERWVVPTALLRDGEDADERVDNLRCVMQERGWSYPVILKPDVAERGTGLRLAQNEASARTYFSEMGGDVLVQTYHPGPYEAGIFYYRLPGKRHGTILSITDKEFPVIAGDGEHTLRQLIWLHKRYRMQARTFFKRHKQDLDHVFEKGEKVPLGMAGNHAQGALFRDGAHLVTPALCERMDSIADGFPGFDFGRFDVRYSDIEKFKAGEDLAIVEVNGALSESTNIYDPKFTLVDAHRLLFRQWAILFKIGALRIRRGARVPRLGAVVGRIFRHVRSRPDAVSD